MRWEPIGSLNTGQMPQDEGWILWCLDIAQQYIELVCGRAPPGCKVGVMWQEHDLGHYPSLGVCYEDSTQWEEYARLCEEALVTFDRSVNWFDLKEYFENSVDELANNESMVNLQRREVSVREALLRPLDEIADIEELKVMIRKLQQVGKANDPNRGGA